MSKGNVCFQKTDFGSETPDFLSKYVPKTTEIAGISLLDNISKEELKNALSVPEKVSDIENDLNFITNDEFQLANDKIFNLTEKNQKLEQSLAAEISDRTENDTAMQADISILKTNSHSHDNKDVIDNITSDDIKNWNGIKEQVTQEQLDKHINYANEINMSLMREIVMLYGLLGVVVYNGGLFGEVYDGKELDGGSFSITPDKSFDCGDFKPLSISIETAQTIDCGTY